ncbi:MAG: hypothetical protein KAU28_01750 [Phycisphaerae bacterium]|nr:hypothetical protein [Phycisphaerae bacterium]
MDVLTKICVVVLVVLVLVACPVFVKLASETANYKQAWLNMKDAKAMADHTAMVAQLATQRAQQDRDASEKKFQRDIEELQRKVSIARTALSEARTAKTALEREKAALLANQTTLARDIELNTARIKQLQEFWEATKKDVTRLTKRNVDLTALYNEAQVVKQRQEKQVRFLKELLAEAREQVRIYEERLGSGKATAAMEGPVTPDVEITGTITAVDGELASINVGSAKGIKRNMKLCVYRHDQFVGYLRIDQVRVDESAGVLTTKRLDPMQGDKVTTKLKP